MKDFTVDTFKLLLKKLGNKNFNFQTFNKFLDSGIEQVIILRHDVDQFPENSLRFAKIENKKNICSTYYFRIVPESLNEKIIKEIYSMGHEIGYHYEDVSLVTDVRRQASGEGRRMNDARHTEEEIVKMAIESFKKNLAKLREIVPVKTICMHGSPMSRWDSRLLWKYYDYHNFGIVGEPYFDIDFNEVMYLTDTGRRWDGDAVSVRDRAHDTRRTTQGVSNYEDWKVKPVRYRKNASHENLPFSQSSLPPLFPSFHSTFDIILAAEEGKLPDKMMMTFHPQRWTDKPVPWVKELVWQNVKNVGKYFLIRMRAEGGGRKK
jgi:hypothetical protein